MKEEAISFNKSKYKFLPLSSFAPKGSKIPVLTLVSLAIDFIMYGLNWGYEKIHWRK